MDERLLLSVTPELLDGWCGPVVFRWDHNGPKRAHMVSWDGDLYDDCGLVEDQEEYRQGLHLDLARAECRDRVARVLFGCPDYAVTDDDPGMDGVSGPRGLWLWADGRVYCSDARAAAYFRGQHLPTMPSDWRDDTRLPDGSRLVDALALAAVAREVLR